MCWWHQAALVGQDQPQGREEQTQAADSRAGRRHSVKVRAPQRIPTLHRAMGSMLNIHTQHRHTELSQPGPPTWRTPISRTIFLQKYSCHWPCITSINSWLWQPDSIHSLSRKNLPPKQRSLPGREFSSREGQASRSTKGRENCTAVQTQIPLSWGSLAEQLKHLVQFHWQQPAHVVLMNRSRN